MLLFICKVIRDNIPMTVLSCGIRKNNTSAKRGVNLTLMNGCATHHYRYNCLGCRYGFRGFYEGHQPMVLTEESVVDIQISGECLSAKDSDVSSH